MAKSEDRHPRVRMEDVARAVGVTAVTVSNALNNREGVSDELRARIVKAATDMGYTRIKVNSQRERPHMRLGVIVPEYYLNEPDAFYWNFTQAIGREAGSRGISVGLELLDTTTLRNMVLPRLVSDRDATLLILLGPPGFDYLDMVTRAVRVPTVCLDVSSPTEAVPSVMSANYYGMATMTESLIEAGHTQIGYLGTVGSTDSVTDRYLGYRRALETHGLDYVPEWTIGDRKVQNGKVIIELPDRLPTAMVCNSDRSAWELIKLLAARGVSVPDDLSIVSYDGLVPGLDAPELTTMEVDIERMVHIAIQTLVRRYEGKTIDVSRIAVAGVRKDGATVAPPPTQ